MGVLNAVWCALIKFWNAIQDHVIQNVIDFIAMLIGLLPSFPVQNEPLDWGEFGSAIGYFLPVGTMAQHFVLMLAVIILWYSYEYVMRWIKMIK
ncbi:MAG TPA: hypothetical protein VNS08_17245 [Ureibacillus sp.]|nr:hypothetical protein [Ureibacillus sp.]